MLGEQIGLDFQFCANSEEALMAVDKPLISYSEEPLAGELYFKASSLLLKSGVDELDIQVTQWDGMPIFFQVDNSILPFDPFAAAFYLVSRYEEYLPHKRDHYDRFDPVQSLAYRNGFLDQPVVNSWGDRIKEILQKAFPTLVFRERKYRFVPTIDVDNAYAYLEKGLARTTGAFARSLMRADFQDIRRRGRCILGLDPDPFDTFGKLLDLQKQYEFDPLYFFLVADYGLNDKNVPITSRKFQSLIKSVFDYAEVGIHPSFMSNTEPHRLKIELARLATVLHAEVHKSRQHFLKLRLPETYRRLIELEIKEDYSMGYPSVAGFRAGICDSFLFYDLDLEQTTALRVHPFCLMEGTYRFYKQTGPGEALQGMKAMIETIKAHRGTFIPLWHNESLSGEQGWQGWENVFEEMIKMALPE